MPKLNTTLLMSSAEYFSNDAPINPYYANESVDVNEACMEHSRIRHALELAGAAIRLVAAPPDSQDGVYTANWALVRGKKAVLARLPNARKAEEAWAEARLTELDYDVIHVPEDWRFSGQGDALPCGDLLFCGSAYRSDVRAQEFAADTLGFRRIQLQTIPLLDVDGRPVVNVSSGWLDSDYYDIDLALSILRAPEGDEKGIIAYCPDAFTSESQKILEELDEVEKIIVSVDEARGAFACNLVSTGETVVMSANAPEFQRKLEDRGFEVITPHVSELAKGGGYIRCVSLAID